MRRDKLGHAGRGRLLRVCSCVAASLRQFPNVSHTPLLPQAAPAGSMSQWQKPWEHPVGVVWQRPVGRVHMVAVALATKAARTGWRGGAQGASAPSHKLCSGDLAPATAVSASRQPTPTQPSSHPRARS